MRFLCPSQQLRGTLSSIFYHIPLLQNIISLMHLYATHIGGVILELSPMFESFAALDTIPGVN